MRTSATPRSTSVCDTRHLHAVVRHDPRHGEYLVSTHHERPALTVRAGDLGVDEHVLDLSRAAGESVAGAPGSYLKASEVGTDHPLAPLHLAREVDRRLLEPEPRVLAHRLDASAEVDALGPDRRVEELGERRGQRPPLVERAQ